MKRDFRRRVNDEFRDGQRDVSYGELAALGESFDEQLAERGVTLEQEDYDEAFLDFVIQYQNGDDDPQVNLSPLGIFDSQKIKDASDLSVVGNGQFYKYPELNKKQLEALAYVLGAYDVSHIPFEEAESLLSGTTIAVAGSANGLWGFIRKSRDGKYYAVLGRTQNIYAF